MCREVVLRSADRTSGTSANFTLKWKSSLINEGTGSTKISLLYAQIPHAVHNIDSTNDTIAFNDGTAALIASVAAGIYSASTLASAIATAMTAASSGYGGLTFTGSFNSSTLLITISATGNFTLSLTDAHATIAAALGFATTSNLSGAATYTATKISTLYEPSFLEILIDPFAKPGLTSSAKPFSFIVPVNVNAGDIIEWSTHAGFKQSIVTSELPQSWTVSVRANGRVVDLHGADWVILLKITKEGCGC